MVRLSSLEIHIALSNLRIDVRILAQGHYVAIISRLLYVMLLLLH